MNNENSQDEQLAVAYVNDQLIRTRASLRNTQLTGVILILAVLGYMTFVSTRLRREFEPRPAARNAKSIIAAQVHEHANDFAAQLKKILPGYVAQLPDYLLKHMQTYRSDLEGRVSADLASYAKNTSSQLSRHLDTFMAEHQEKIKELLHHSQDIGTVREMGGDLEKEITAYFREKSADGESIEDKFHHALVALDGVSRHLDRLANGNDLTTNERKLRQAIAIVMNKADWEAAKRAK